MTTTLNVNNIKCGGCAASIINKLSKIEGISEVHVDPDTREVKFNATTKNSTEKARTSLAQMGYSEEDPNMLQTAKSYISCIVGKMKK